MSSVAILGDYDSIFGFTSVGIAIHPAANREEAIRQLRYLEKQKTEIIFITEQLAHRLSEEIRELRRKKDIAVILLPGLNGNTGEGIENIKKMVERAVGSDILF